jgi:cell division protein YceG involved in septum cleavage
VAIFVALFTWLYFTEFSSDAIAKKREARIVSIYNSLGLQEAGYRMQSKDIFGDKRVYDWDSGRTQSSSEKFYSGRDVATTRTDLDKVIKSVGFKFIEKAYEGSTSEQWHYKSDKGEYIRLTVSSKQRDDAFIDAYLMGNMDPVIDKDPNAAPSVIEIKVNLDDNNE